MKVVPPARIPANTVAAHAQYNAHALSGKTVRVFCRVDSTCFFATFARIGAFFRFALFLFAFP
jgi:hypothetical protein